MMWLVVEREMGFCYFTILIIICNSISNECRTVTYNNVDLINSETNNQTRKIKEYVRPVENITEMVVSNKNKYRITRSNLKQLKSLTNGKKNSPYTVAIFKDEKRHENFPSNTLAIFEPNPESNISLAKPIKINLNEDQFIIPEVDEDTREGEVFLNNVGIDENNDAYQLDQSLNHEYHTINEHEILFPANDSYFVDSSYQLNDNFIGYPESHQPTSTTENSAYFYGYSYHPPSAYLPPTESGAYLPPAPNPTYLPPALTATYLPPKPSGAYLSPAPTVTYLPPKPSGAYLPPKPTESYLPPKPTESYLPPKPSGAYLPPKPTESYLPPKPTESYLPPKPSGAYLPSIPHEVYLPGAENEIILHELNNFSGNNNTKVVKMKEHDLSAHYYIGYKFWYAALVFAIYHVIMVIFFHLTILAKHYTKFPAALHAAAASAYDVHRRDSVQEDSVEIWRHQIRSSLTKIKSFIFIVKQTLLTICAICKKIFHFGEKCQEPVSGRGIITLMIWNIPLYFNIYFIAYMSYLIIKSIARHKIELPYLY